MMLIPAITGAQDQKPVHADCIELPRYCVEMLALLCEGKMNSAIKLKYEHSKGLASQMNKKQSDSLNGVTLLNTPACATFMSGLFDPGDTDCLHVVFDTGCRTNGVNNIPVADLLFFLDPDYLKRRNYWASFALNPEAVHLYKKSLIDILPRWLLKPVK